MTYISNINQLKDIGYKVKVIHTRYTDSQNRINPKGGKTTVILTDPTGNTSEGHSICSKEDPFVKSLGIRIAIGRALKK